MTRAWRRPGSPLLGSCGLVETVDLTITAGNLTQSKLAGNVAMTGITLDGAAHTSTGSLQDVTVKDYRGGSLGWSLVGRFSGLTGPAKPTRQLHHRSQCHDVDAVVHADATNNDDTVVTGGAGAFVDAATAQPLCSVSTGGLGADGTSGGDTVADADLSLAVGANQAAGSYTGTITLTLS